jgi:segregation and condensation protein A
MYQVKLEKFEGPMDLLLDLIEKEKLDITELSLSKVTDQYLEYLRDSRQIHLENLSEFLSIASKLILIKSRALLPTLTMSQDDEAEIKDLELQLANYKRFKEAAAKVGGMWSRLRIGYTREGFRGAPVIFFPPENINQYDLKKYFLGVLAEIPLIEKLQEEIVREVVTLEQRINQMESQIRRKIETSFSEMVATSGDKIEVIVSFLAMLEMIKQRIVQVDQEDIFGSIKLRISEVNETDSRSGEMLAQEIA